MKKVIALGCLLVILFSSCSHENPSPSAGDLNEVLVKKIYLNLGGPPEINSPDFTYSGKKIQKMHFGPYVSTNVLYTYTGDVITSEESLSSYGNGLFNRKYIYEYDVNGRLEGVKLKLGNNGSFNQYKKYTYNADGTVLENNNPNDQMTYYYNNGNISKTTRLTPNESVSMTYNYDNKNSPFKNVTGLNNLNIFYQCDDNHFYVFSVGNKHNITSIVNEITGELNYNVKYNYDLLNFPVDSGDPNNDINYKIMQY